MVEDIQTVRKRAIQAQSQIVMLKTQLKNTTEQYEARLAKIYLGTIEKLDEVEQREGENSVCAVLLLQTLELMGITRLAAPVNTVPSYCEVVGSEPNPARPNGAVLRIVSHGYRLDDVLLRKTKVIVVQNI